jgi:transcriptional regulator with XRE-family HTH domain
MSTSVDVAAEGHHPIGASSRSEEVHPMSGPETGGSLADKIDYLFRSVRRPDGTEHSMEEVARWCAEQTGESFSKQYVSLLRKGQRTNPTKRHIEALARFFDVPVEYFFDAATAAEIRANLDLAIALRKAGVRQVALRATTLDEVDLQEVVRLIEDIGRRKREKEEK